MRALKLPKFSGRSVKPFLLRSSLVMWERRGKLGGKLGENWVEKMKKMTKSG